MEEDLREFKITEVHVPGQLTGPVPTRPPIGQHSTPAPPYMQPLHLQIFTLYDQQSKRADVPIKHFDLKPL